MCLSQLIGRVSPPWVTSLVLRGRWSSTRAQQRLWCSERLRGGSKPAGTFQLAGGLLHPRGLCTGRHRSRSRGIWALEKHPWKYKLQGSAEITRGTKFIYFLAAVMGAVGEERVCWSLKNLHCCCAQYQSINNAATQAAFVKKTQTQNAYLKKVQWENCEFSSISRFKSCPVQVTWTHALWICKVFVVVTRKLERNDCAAFFLIMT